jgi:DNA-binding IclR family transcriptional regulator
LTKAQLGTVAKFKITGGTFQTYWGTLRRAGYVAEDGREVYITDDGLAYEGVTPGPPPTTEEILERWRSSLKAGARRMLDEVLAQPTGIARDELALNLDMAESGGTFQTYLGTLRRNGLVSVEGAWITPGDALYVGR